VSFAPSIVIIIVKTVPSDEISVVTSHLELVIISYLDLRMRTLPGLASSFIHLGQGQASSLIYDDIDRASIFDPFIDKIK
jgi:hypothetical protein